MKLCKKCETEKSLTEFSKDKTRTNGHSPYCKSCTSVYKKAYAVIKKEKLAAYHKEYRINNLNKLQKYHANYLKTGGAEVRKAYREANPDRIKSLKNHNEIIRRRAKVTSALTGTEYADWINNQIKLCCYCGTDCAQTYHVDHIIPLAKNGKHELDNLTIACPSCNTSKGQKSLIEFLAFKQNTK